MASALAPAASIEGSVIVAEETNALSAHGVS